ncbi:hypothetical protein VM1G_11783 [Cytospora mali]|uniref:Uncharacterized protein n=1 Tax=Cytospora mali TaxID=578113 RepID=A0A194W4Z7_CYTMA|nr:hypothetical protein VM1G_11783 [Valsa mali]
MRKATTCERGALRSRVVYFCMDAGSWERMRSARDCCFWLVVSVLFHRLPGRERSLAARGEKLVVVLEVVVGVCSGPKPRRREERRRCFHMVGGRRPGYRVEM